MKQIAQAQWRYLDRAKKDAVRHHRKPAIVFDADDTTLWTYDMEDAAMHFNFDPTLQNEWVQDQRFPATPAMVDFVNRAKQMGFAIFGLTGRSDDPEGRDPRQPDQGRLHAVQRRQLLHQVDGRGATRSRRTSPARPRAARRSSTRPAPASTSRRTSATTSCSTSATSGPTSRAGTPTTCSSCPTRRTTCPAPTSTARRPSRAFAPRTPVHDEARRLERRHRGR